MNQKLVPFLSTFCRLEYVIMFAKMFSEPYSSASCAAGPMDAELHGGMNVWVRDSEWSLRNCHLSPTTMDYASVAGYCANELQVPLTINTGPQKHKFRTSDCSQGSSVWAGLSDAAVEMSWVSEMGELINPNFMSATLDGFSTANCMDISAGVSARNAGGMLDDQV